MITLLDTAIGPIKTRDRGCRAGELLVGLASAQLAGQELLVGLDRQRADLAGQQISPVAGLPSTTAAGLAQRFTGGQCRAVETGVAQISDAVIGRLPQARQVRLAQSVTIDLDTTDVQVYGQGKRGVADNYQGQRAGRPHVAIWAETETVLAAELLAGDADARPGAAGLLRRAVASVPRQVRRARIRLRAEGGYFARQLARAAFAEDVEGAIGATRITAVWRLLDGIGEAAWADAIDWDGAHVAVADYRPQ